MSQMTIVPNKAIVGDLEMEIESPRHLLTHDGPNKKFPWFNKILDFFNFRFLTTNESQTKITR